MEYLQHLLEQYKTGKASEEERAELLSLLEAQGADLQQVLREAYGNGLATGASLMTSDKAALLLQKMHEQMQPAATGNRAHSRSGRVVWMKRLAWTAAAVLLLTAGAQWWQWSQKTTPPLMAAAANTDTNEVLQIRNTTRQKDTMQLPDGSVAVLHPGSTLSFARHFDTAYRSLYLQGEACFTVIKDTRRPFTVYANGIATTALGTRFSVSTFYNEQVRVRLLEGKVVVQAQEQRLAMHPVYLTPGQECMVNNINGVTLVNTFPLTTHRSGHTVATGNTPVSNGALEFSRAPLTSVFKRLEKEYHVSITYPGITIGRLSFTGTFLPTDSLSVVLTIICKTNDLAFVQKDNQVTITSLP